MNIEGKCSFQFLFVSNEMIRSWRKMVGSGSRGRREPSIKEINKFQYGNKRDDRFSSANGVFERRSERLYDCSGTLHRTLMRLGGKRLHKIADDEPFLYLRRSIPYKTVPGCIARTAGSLINEGLISVLRLFIRTIVASGSASLVFRIE